MVHYTAHIRRYGGVLGSCATIALGSVYLARSDAQSIKEGQLLPGAVANSTNASPIYGVTVPDGYRDWKLISAGRIEGVANDLRAELGNDVAIKAYRQGKLPFPDGTVIARLAYRAVTSEENNAVFRAAAERQGLPPAQVAKLLAESLVAGPATNVEFMVKDSKKYATTGGWGFGQFTNGKADGEAVHETCFPCHSPAKDRDFVFTHYAPAP
jgi:hypothetical protein